MEKVFIDIILLGIAAACWAVCSHYTFQNRVRKPYSFWGTESWVRKYDHIRPYASERAVILAAPDNWYYRLFKIKYKERFPLSATALVFVTDGYHLTQWIMIKAICGAIATCWTDFFVYWILWTMVFNVVYITLKKP